MIGLAARILFWVALVAGVSVTIAGMMAPWIPYAELFNHFRPFWIVGACGLMAMAVLARASPVGFIAAGAVLSINIGFAAVPTLWSASAGDRMDIRIVTFNVWVGNQKPDAIVAYVTSSDADVVLLQEVDARLEKAIAPAVAADYPHIVSCAKRNCGMMLLAKAPWKRSGSSDRFPDSPPLIWAEFPGFTVTGTHLAYPFQPLMQMVQTDTLARQFRHTRGLQIVAGDFNLTPYSWKLNLLSSTTGLLRHATWGATWPAHRLAPVVLLDNLLASPTVTSVEAAVGPAGLGSDHRPVVFDLKLDPKAGESLTPPS